MSIEANGKTFAYPFGPEECRISKIDSLAIAHTNTSRGYQTYRGYALQAASKTK